MEHLEHWAALLKQHQKQRLRGVPTISLLVGDKSTHRSLRQRSEFVGLISTPSNEAETAQRWLASPRVQRAATDFCARRLQRPLETMGAELARKPDADLHAALDAHGIDPGDLSEKVLRWLLEGRGWQHRPKSRDPLELVIGALPLLAEVEPPGLIFRGELDAPDWLLRGASLFERMACSAPAVPLVVTGSPMQLQVLRSAPPSRAGALLGEGLILLAPLGDHHPTATGEGIGSELGDARSAAEQFLFERLQAHPPTAGLFRLNEFVEFDARGPTGLRRSEVDLVCGLHRLAIEIDGYFHFQDLEAYRRDRRKDLALQAAGFTVIRVLADDVVERLEEILALITGTLERTSKSKREGQ